MKIESMESCHMKHECGICRVFGEYCTRVPVKMCRKMREAYGIAKEDVKKRYVIRSAWISVDERLPERTGAYLTYTFRGYTKISHFEEWAIGEAPSFDDYTVTHWMPLPEPPNMKGEHKDERKTNA